MPASAEMEEVMPNIEVGALEDHLSDEELEEVQKRLEKADVGTLPEGDGAMGRSMLEGADEDALTELMDRLESHDLAANIYVPLEFEGRLEAGDLSVASLNSLVEALEELAEDLEIEDLDEPEEPEDEDELAYASEMELLEGRVRHIWRAMYEGAQLAMEHDLCLVVTM